MEIVPARTAREARALFLQRSFDVCLVNLPLEDGGGERFARDAVSVGLTQVLLLVREEDYPELSARCDKLGIFTLSKPITKKALLSALHFAQITRARLLDLRERNAELARQVQEVRLIARAKCILVQYLNMTETEAHRYIEKQAMDMRITRRNVAENILKTYES